MERITQFYVCKWAAMADYVLLKGITVLAKRIDTFLSGLQANLVTVASQRQIKLHRLPR